MALPEPTAWRDIGVAIDTGSFGSWDTIMEGITPTGVLHRDGVYLLYYVGAQDYIAALDNIGPAQRAIGVATSRDGINWTKAPENPVITFSSSGNPEEGAVSLGVTTAQQEVLAYYGANVAQTATSPDVNADVRLAMSPDGLSFTDHGTVVGHRDTSVWGYGDEIHPTLAISGRGMFHVFYVPNGTRERDQLAVCAGPTPTSVGGCGPVWSDDGPVRSRGPSSVVPLGGDTLAVFVSRRGAVDAYVVDGRELSCFGAPVHSYPTDGGAVVMLDAARRTWFAYVNAWTHIGLKVAPAGPSDATPPTPPAAVRGRSPRYDQVALTWSDASDDETGILEYVIYRHGSPIGRTRGRSFVDSGLRERTAYDYEVRAVNPHGLEGAGTVYSLRTIRDTVPPAIETVAATAPRDVVVTFTEPVAAFERGIHRYRLSDGVRVRSAIVSDDPRVVRLTTTPMASGAVYTVTAHVADRAMTPNVGTTSRSFTAASVPGLVGYWRMDEADSAGIDSSGSANHATVSGAPRPTEGRVLGGIELSGRDYLEVMPSASLDETAFSSITVAAWVRPARTPPGTTNVNGAYTIFAGPGGLSLKYGSDGRFVGTFDTSAEPWSLSSEVFPPGTWRHVALVVDGSRRTAWLFVDGQAVPGSPRTYRGERTRVSHLSPNHDAYHRKYRIGVASPTFAVNSDYLEGQLDEVRVYGRALTQEEIQALP